MTDSNLLSLLSMLWGFPERDETYFPLLEFSFSSFRSQHPTLSLLPTVAGAREAQGGAAPAYRDLAPSASFTIRIFPGPQEDPVRQVLLFSLMPTQKLPRITRVIIGPL